MNGRDLFSSSFEPDKRFKVVFGKNVPPTESMMAEWIGRHRGWTEMIFKTW